MLLFASGLTDPELSMAATAHFFAWAGLEFPAAVNGPQYLADRGTMDAQFRPRGDMMHVPTGPGLGVALADEVQTAMIDWLRRHGKLYRHEASDTLNINHTKKRCGLR